MCLRNLSLCAVVGLAMGIASLTIAHSKAPPTIVAPAKRPLAPGFLLKDLGGREVQLKDFRGKVVLLNFWATWCSFCKEAIPWFNEFDSRHRSSGLVVLGVAMDQDVWNSRLLDYVANMRVTYPILIGDAFVAEIYGGVDTLPLTLLIDRQGRIAARYVGLSNKSLYDNHILQIMEN